MFDHTSLMKPTDDTTCVNDVICLTENIYQDRIRQTFDIKHFGPSNMPTDDQIWCQLVWSHLCDHTCLIVCGALKSFFFSMGDVKVPRSRGTSYLPLLLFVSFSISSIFLPNSTKATNFMHLASGSLTISPRLSKPNLDLDLKSRSSCQYLASYVKKVARGLKINPISTARNGRLEKLGLAYFY